MVQQLILCFRHFWVAERKKRRRLLPLAMFFFLMFLPVPAIAGGSWLPVHVQKITMLSDTDYILVVAPTLEQQTSQDPFFGDCKHFEVHGTYGRPKGKIWFLTLFPSERKRSKQNRKKHLAALKTLRQFEETKAPLNFGWVGTGFHVLNSANPCVVESRSLILSEDSGVTAVLSRFK